MHLRSSEGRAEGEADFACGLKPLKAKCVVPFIASPSRQSRQAQNKKDRFFYPFYFCLGSDENAVLRSADFDNSEVSDRLQNKKFAKTSICLKDK